VKEVNKQRFLLYWYYFVMVICYCMWTK